MTTENKSSGAGFNSLAVPAVRSRKRGLTVSAPSPDDLKKAKVEVPPLPTLPTLKAETRAPINPGPKPEEASDVESDDSHEDPNAESSTAIPEEEDFIKDYTLGEFVNDGSYDAKYRQPRIYRLPGDGPHTMFTCSDMISNMVSGIQDDTCWLVLKPTMLAIASAVDGLPTDEATERASDLTDHLGWWRVDIDEEAEKAAETDEAEALKKIFSDLEAPDHQWWYEVTVQREKPAKGVPALEIKFSMYLPWYHVAKDQEGSWWITGFAVPDEESNKAAKIMEENIPMFIINEAG